MKQNMFDDLDKTEQFFLQPNFSPLRDLKQLLPLTGF